MAKSKKILLNAKPFDPIEPVESIDSTDSAGTKEQESEDTLLETLRRQNGAKSYADFISESYGTEPRLAHERALSDAAREYSESAVGYGRRGEALADAGLMDSGYAAYLEQERERAFDEAKLEANRELRAWESLAKQGYAKYLEEYRKTQESRMSSAVRILLSDNFGSGEQAYRYGLSIGLEDERAQMLRDMSEAYGADQFRDSTLSARINMLNNITGKHMSYEQAYRYALALGAPEETAERIARYAESSTNEILDWLNKQ